MTTLSILRIIWLYLPIGLANSAPVLVAKLPHLQNFTYPLDSYKTLNQKRIFGANKTYRGLIAGCLMGSTVLVFEYFLAAGLTHFGVTSSGQPELLTTHNVAYFAAVGALLGAGSLLADALKSFVKRQLGKAPGQMWFPFDQLDYIIGGVLVLRLFERLSFEDYVLLGLLGIVMHILSNFFAFLTKLKSVPY